MTQLLLSLLDKGGYLGIFVLMILENVFPPIPSEVILVGAGALVEQGRMDAYLLWIVATAGTLAGNLFWFWLGARWSEETLKRVIDRWGRWLTFEWDEFLSARADVPQIWGRDRLHPAVSRRYCAPSSRCRRAWRG
ncbi:MAG: hypothetical protein KatS3mg120_0068 [Erythrobacter sp.]|nr:MAG: hypothetical protein KatS3mg120_0068 [Erythrobacter sp.]